MVNKEQKTALSFLIISKAFERLAFYMIMAIFFFYLTDSVKMQTEEAGEFYSWFYASIALSTLTFGLLGDFMNRQKLVKLGMLLLTVFYLVLIFLPVNLIFQQTAFIALGISIGMTISNTIVLLGNAYNERKTQIFGLSGFIFFSLAINFGAYLAPAISTAIKDVIGFTPIFVIAFIFALISFVLYLFFDNKYSKLELFAEQRKNLEPEYKNINITILVSIFIIGIVLKGVLYQKGFTLNGYIRDYVANGYDLASRLHNIDNRISIFILLLFGIIIIKIKKLNWNTLFNLLIIGSVLSALVYVSFAFIGDNAGEKVNSAIALIMYSILLLAETIISAIIFYAIYRAAPIKYKGLFQGLSFVLFYITNKLIFFGLSVFEEEGPSVTFIVFSLFFIIGAILVLTLMKLVNRKLKDLEEI